MVVVGVLSLMNLDATFVSLAAMSGWWVLLICELVELGLGFWAAGSWDVSVLILVTCVAAGALVQGFADRLGVTGSHAAA